MLVRGSLEGFIDAHLAGNDALVREAQALNNAANLGSISYEEMLKEYARMANISFEQAGQEMGANPRNDRLLDYINDKLKATYKISMLSNAPDDWLDELFSKDNVALFDDIVLSYRVRMIKPQPEIYRLAAGRLGLEEDECVFIDDIERYCVGAQEAGMQAIVYKDFGQMRSELEQILAADSDE